MGLHNMPIPGASSNSCLEPPVQALPFFCCPNDKSQKGTSDSKYWCGSSRELETTVEAPTGDCNMSAWHASTYDTQVSNVT
jgi:hypothetical protein